MIGEVITKFELEWNDGYNGYFSYRKDRRYIYANGKEIAERRIDVGVQIPFDATVLKTSDASGVDKLEMTLLGYIYSAVSLNLDPFGADVSNSDAYPPPPAGGRDPNDADCVWIDYDDYNCDFPDEYDEPENEDQQTGSIPENTCYVDGVEADCNEVAENPELYESDDVALEDEDKAPSEEGPQAVWDDDDQSSHGDSEGEEREFEVEYSGMNARIRGEITVNVSMPMPRLSSWDLRRETSLERQQTQQDNGLITTKPGRVSTNITPRTLDDGDCRFLMNELFGSQNSVTAGYYNPPTVKDSRGKPFGEGYKNPEIDTEIATHIYGGFDGTMSNAPIYIPANPDGSAPKILPRYIGQNQAGTGNATYITGERTESGGGISTSNVFRLSNGLVIVANHIGGYDKNYKSGERNRQGSFRVGYIGGPGGDGGTGFFIHTHISFFRDGKRVDPRRKFCSGNYHLK